MTLSRLEVACLRNLQFVSLSPHPDLNILYGPNGSGKTSLLEAIYLLGTGRSFRAGRVRQLVMDGEDSCTVFGAFADGCQSGIRCNPGGITDIRVNGTQAFSLAELARPLPLVLLDPMSLEAFDEGSKPRRAQLDWGVFHVEREFFPVWRSYQKALKQRNSLLRSGSIRALEVRPWHTQLAISAERLHSLRSAFFVKWRPLWESHAQALLPDVELELDYLPGWDVKDSLERLLTDSWDRDVERGFTQLGPHRADIRLRVDGAPANETLSRGQRKLAIFALKLSQQALLQSSGIRCTLLIDDLASELDGEARGRLLDALIKVQSQVFLTAIEEESVLAPLRNAGQAYKMFHVEHGCITEV